VKLRYPNQSRCRFHSGPGSEPPPGDEHLESLLPAHALARGGQLCGRDGVEAGLAVEFEGEPATAPLARMLEREFIQADAHDKAVVEPSIFDRTPAGVFLAVFLPDLGMQIHAGQRACTPGDGPEEGRSSLQALPKGCRRCACQSKGKTALWRGALAKVRSPVNHGPARRTPGNYFCPPGAAATCWRRRRTTQGPPATRGWPA